MLEISSVKLNVSVCVVCVCIYRIPVTIYNLLKRK